MPRQESTASSPAVKTAYGSGQTDPELLYEEQLGKVVAANKTLTLEKEGLEEEIVVLRDRLKIIEERNAGLRPS